MSGPAMPIALRAYKPEDRNFVTRAWVKAMRESAESLHVPNAVYYDAQHALIDKILPASATVIACDPQNDNNLYGCLVAERMTHVPVCHWVYVKDIFRRAGIASEMVRAAFGDRRPILCTHATHLFNHRELVADWGLIYCGHYLLLGIAPNLSERAA